MLTEIKPSSLKDKEVDSLLQSADSVLIEIFQAIINSLIYPRIDSLSGEVLDLLAWQFHIEGWELARTETEKRELIKKAIDIHKLKGTLAGFRYALCGSGAKLLKLLLPKDRVFLSLTLTDEQRRKWYSLFPELRIVEFSHFGERFMRYRKNFQGSSLFPYISDAYGRYGIRSLIYKGGIAIPLVTQETMERAIQKQAVKIVEIHEKSKAVGHFLQQTDRFLYDHEARKRIYTVRIPETYADFETTIAHHILHPSLEPLDIRYETVAEKGKRHRKLAFCDFVLGHPSITDARTRLYKRLYLYDESVMAERRNAFCFLNERPIRMPPFHAEAKVQIRDVLMYRKFPRKTDKNSLSNALVMLKEMSSVRDRIYLDTVTKRVPTADGTITAGMNIKTGEVVNV